MPTDTFDQQPNDAELLQLEDGGDEAAVLVNVSGPVRVQQLPTKAVAPKSYQIGTATSVQILFADPKRASAILSCTGFPVILSAERLAAADISNGFCATGFPLPVAAVFGPTLVKSSLYAIAIGGTAVVGVFAENWAAGDD